jgi:xylulokinase
MYLRVARLDPTRAARTASLAGAKDYLFGWLTGRLLTDPSTATGFGCFDLAAGAWSQPVLAAAGRLVPTALPALPGLAGSGEQHPLRPELAARLGLPAGLAVAVGGADSVLGALGLGAGQAGDTAYLAGTSTVILGVSGTPTPDPEQRYLITPLAGSAGWGLEMDLLATGSSVRWLAELVGGPGADTDAQLDEAADIAPEDAPVLLPYLAPGEQGALWDPTLAGTLYGMTLHHDRRHLLRALQTGIVLESRRCLAVLADVAGTGDVWVGGGGIRPALAAELAAASRRSVRRPVAGGDESALGAALLVAAGPPPATAVVHPPDPAEARRWDELARRHEAALVAARGYYRADHRHSP